MRSHQSIASENPPRSPQSSKSPGLGPDNPQPNRQYKAVVPRAPSLTPKRCAWPAVIVSSPGGQQRKRGPLWGCTGIREGVPRWLESIDSILHSDAELATAERLCIVRGASVRFETTEHPTAR